MIIKSIKLTNFRNHTSYNLECNQDTTLILGKNGCGKTSVLEAIYISLYGKSFRATDQDIIKHGSDFYRIELISDLKEKIIVTYDGTKKSFTISDKKTSRLPKKNKYPIILFQPSDLNLISGSPSRHREYFDRILSSINEEYNQSLSKYNKALRQRNELLKTDNISPALIFSWNVLLAKYGTYINHYRNTIVAEINQQLTSTYYSITNHHDDIYLKYQTEINSYDENLYLKTLESNLKKDSLLGHTSFGVHKDDFIFEFNHKLANGSASRGETRSIILALKFIEANIIINRLNQKPIILLDDVFSELDDTHRKCLIENFKNHQIIITSVEDFIH